MTTTRAGGDGYGVRERSSFSCTASRMKAARRFLPATASMRASVSGVKRTGTITAASSLSSRGRPIRRGLSDIVFSAKPVILSDIAIDVEPISD